MISPLASYALVVPREVDEVLGGYRRAHGHDAWLWVRGRGDWVVAAGSGPALRSAPGPEAEEVEVGAEGEARVEVAAPDPKLAREAARFLATVLSRLLRHDAEARFFGRELAERYEEITLLYSISEILGSVISLERATAIILSEVTGTLAVERAALWVHNAEREQLELIAAVGGGSQLGPIDVEDEKSVTATVFRTRRPTILEPAQEFPRGEYNLAPENRGSFLSVPVSYTPPEGEPRTVGVINLIGREGGETFSAGDQKLIAAIASQIGAAVENSRLVASSLRQERLVRELELAHDLQLKLLPPLEQFDGYAEVAARCAPADSVGGDFYHLFRLPAGRLGVMIGDVSSHGFGAALIMALTMSAVAIHASDGDAPATVLRRIHQTLIDELETTEMYLTLFYGVIDPRAGRITYANAGHPHAFRVDATGAATRLGATNPPLGIVDLDAYDEESIPWAAGQDVLLLFTDGLSDSVGEGEIAGERRLVDAAVAGRELPLADLLPRLFDFTNPDPEVPADDRTALLVRL